MAYDSEYLPAPVTDSIEPYHQFWSRGLYMAKTDEILKAVAEIDKGVGEVKKGQDDLKERLLSPDGEIPLIRHHMEKLNGIFLDHEVRLVKIETKKRNGKKVLGIGGGTTSIIIAIIYGVGKLVGWW